MHRARRISTNEVVSAEYAVTNGLGQEEYRCPTAGCDVAVYLRRSHSSDGDNRHVSTHFVTDTTEIDDDHTDNGHASGCEYARSSQSMQPQRPPLAAALADPAMRVVINLNMTPGIILQREFNASAGRRYPVSGQRLGPRTMTALVPVSSARQFLDVAEKIMEAEHRHGGVLDRVSIHYRKFSLTAFQEFCASAGVGASAGASAQGIRDIFNGLKGKSPACINLPPGSQDPMPKWRFAFPRLVEFRPQKSNRSAASAFIPGQIVLSDNPEYNAQNKKLLLQVNLVTRNRKIPAALDQETRAAILASDRVFVIAAPYLDHALTVAEEKAFKAMARGTRSCDIRLPVFDRRQVAF